MLRKCFLAMLFCLGVSLPGVEAHAAKDAIPDQFTFIDQTGVSPSTVVTSGRITITGINTAAVIRIAGGSYSLNGSAYTTASRWAKNNDTIQVRQTSSSSFGTTTGTILTVGGVSDTFSVTTLPSDTTPDPFSFIDQTGAPIATQVMSNTVTVAGINTPAPISISFGGYSINGGPFTNANGTVNSGDTVQVRFTTSSSFSTQTSSTVTIGGVIDVFSVTTVAAPASGGNPSFTSENFSGSTNCAFCHNGIVDGAKQDVSIETDWSSTTMANASRDPLWRAKVRSELTRNPQLAGVINNKCTRCHAPMANFEAVTAGEPVQIFDGGFLDPAHSRHDEALNGVSCTLCHQIQDSPELGTLAGFSGHYVVNLLKTIYGQYLTPFANPMVNRTGFTPVYSAHIQASKLCATCHNLKTPYVDENGVVLSSTPESEFPEQMPYTEWEQSSYATTTPKSCQDCHMSRTNGVKMSTRPMNQNMLTTRDAFARHEFVGGNALMLDILDTNRQQLGVQSTNFPESLAKTQAMLSGAAGITTLSQSLVGDTLECTLQITSTTGHKLPSAFPSRRVILHVTVKDGQGNVVFESGRVNANGSVAGADADSDPATFEPHYDLITRPDQVQIYEAIMGNNLNQPTYTLLRGMVYLKDNRLLPPGFDKAAAPADVRVAGEAQADSNFVGGSDRISYRISGLTGSAYTVEAELLHQPVAYAFVQDLLVEPSPENQTFKGMFDASSRKTGRIALHTFNVSR